MSRGRLTRDELSWLLTQEAQHAAERLRVGVQLLRKQSDEPAPSAEEPGLDPSLDALDDVMRMLSSLNPRTTPQSGSMLAARRGRVDLAALLVDIAPDARVSIEPGSGTEVYGDEADLRRLLQVLIGHGSGQGASITVRRDGDEVKVAVVLGPDTSPTVETERAWLSRMALRYGGRYELEGGSEVVALPAEEPGERSEGPASRDLEASRRAARERARALGSLARVCRGLASELGRRREGDVAEHLADVAALRAERAAEVDLAAVARQVVGALAAVAEAAGVTVDVRGDAQAIARAAPNAATALLREVVAHAIAASPRGARVNLAVHAASEASAARIDVDDAGAPVPASARSAVLALEQAAEGRPSALPLFLASELATCVAAAIELADAPSGGVRVTVRFARA